MANILNTLKQGLIDLKRDKEDTKSCPQPVCESQEEYPYGLCIDLGTDALDKLKIDITKHQVKDVVTIVAECQVKSVSQSSYSSGKDSKNLSLQITKMKITEGKKVNKE